MTYKLLAVDDDPHFLRFLGRVLGERFELMTASTGAEGLALLQKHAPFAIIVSDLDLANVSGVDFLHQARVCSPESVHVVTTGHPDLESAIALVNEANVFRFLTKPVALDVLYKAIGDSLQQYQLIFAERDILERTLAGAMRVLTEILSMVDPDTFDRAIALRNNVRCLAAEMKVASVWELEMAAMLSRIGCVTIPRAVTTKMRTGTALTQAEQQLIERVPQIGRDLLANIPRLEGVAEIVLYQAKNFDGTGFPDDQVAYAEIPLGARILRVIVDLGELISQGMALKTAFLQLGKREGCYDPAILNAAENSFANSGPQSGNTGFCTALHVRDLKSGQCIVSDIETSDGALLLSTGSVLSEAILEKIRNFQRVSGIKEPILVKGALGR